MEESTPQRSSWLTLLLHSFVPTTVGVIIYLALAVVIIGVHLLGMSLSGTAYPASFDDNVLQGYANFVIQPLSTLANNQIFNSGLTIIVWGVAGWVVCAIVAAIAGAIHDWRNTEKDITIPQEGVVVRHPLHRNLIIRLLWRLFIGMAIILYTAGIMPVIRYCFGNDVVAIQQSSYVTSFYISTFTALVWVAMFHVYVVLFRLYMLRTRLLGEIIY